MPELKFGRTYRYSELRRTLEGSPTKYYGLPDQKTLEKKAKSPGTKLKLPDGTWVKIILRRDDVDDNRDQYVVTKV